MKSKHPVEILIAKADLAINQEDFATLMNYYAEDAILVIQSGKIARGKTEIRQAFEAIASYFNHGLEVKQKGMEILATEDTVLVLAQTLVSAHNAPTVERKATYVFRKNKQGDWVCAIDNSYGHDFKAEGTTIES